MASARTHKVIRGIAIAVIIICVIALVLIFSIYRTQSSYYEQLAEDAAPDLEQSAAAAANSTNDLAAMSVDWDSLRAQNPDIVAWIIVPGTVIDYPVVKSEDNNDYLHRSFSGSTGVWASAGTIFMDCNNSADLTDRNIAFYGHHMRDGSMFARFADFSSQSVFDEHRTIYVLTPTMNYRLTTFACVLTTGTDLIVQTEFASNDDYEAYIQDKLERSVVSQGSDSLTASEIGRSFMFSTCEYSQKNGRAVVYAAVRDSAAPSNG